MAFFPAEAAAAAAGRFLGQGAGALGGRPLCKYWEGVAINIYKPICRGIYIHMCIHAYVHISAFTVAPIAVHNIPGSLVVYTLSYTHYLWVLLL